jgi:alpha-D-xyloside xylohydrolase
MIGGRPVPFSFARRASDGAQCIAASFSLLPAERIFGCGESFSAPDKRGTSVDLWTQDAHGSQTGEMYKPVPFYLSSRGYGVFVHGSSPMTFDFGHDYSDTQVLYCGDETLDLFVFLGGPQDVLSSYTALTGRSPLPPLWSFGLWMSRITYNSETQVREVAAKIREHRIPCDVIHLDTGWFEKDWGCDYRFSATRFNDPKKMIDDLAAQGFRISLWQLPYFSPANGLYDEIVEHKLAVRGSTGDLLTEDAVLDFSNPETIAWYQRKLRGLLELGVDVIKVDFGEGAPYNGVYHSGKSGHHEHNLYPLRYNRAAAEVTHAVTGATLIWARSAWAGSQRYPVHWGGDAEASDGGMLGSLWGGLSLGLSGFSFWSHDVGGFFPATPRDLYRRWLPFGLLSSHSRCHGLPPTEPWEFDAEFLDVFRKTVELRYRLLPYIWAQAAASAAAGHPLLRPLFFEFADDPGSWTVQDAYLLGTSLLVAPLFEEVDERQVYVPPGAWVDLQTERVYQGPGWARIAAGEIPAIVLGRGGSILPTARLGQHTGEVDFDHVQLWVLGDVDQASGLFCAPDQTAAERIEVALQGGALRVTSDPGGGRVHWTVRQVGAR